jgi:hypothetical protein
MIRKTLGWCDENGNPQNEIIAISYSELEKHAGLSHSMIRLAIQQASEGGFIRCVRKGTASSREESGQSAAYELAWDESGEYVKDPTKFKGFFAGDGNRTYIPNQYFDHVVRHESLAIIQTVGAIIRFSIGFVNKYGHRRQRVALSYRDIQRYAGIASPRILSKAIKHAMVCNYIERIEAGYFDPNAGRLSRAAHYAVKWAFNKTDSTTTPKSEAGENRSEKFSGGTPKSEVADHSEKFSDIQIKQTNKTYKQKAASISEGEAAVSFEKLQEAGFDDIAAKAMALRYSFDRIEKQITWIDRRNARSNWLGMLRKAIEENWAEPVGTRPLAGKLGQPNSNDRRGKSFNQAVSGMRGRLLDQSSKSS